jgi:general stress protein 26
MRKGKSSAVMVLCAAAACLLGGVSFAVGTPQALSRERLLAVAREIMISARYCALITRDGAGRSIARAMDAIAPDANMVVWLGTNPRTRKIPEIRRDPSVTLYYFDPASGGYVTILGNARIVTAPDEKQRHWKEGWEAFYPDREAGFALIAVTPERVEVVSPKHKIEGNTATWTPPSVEFGPAAEARGPLAAARTCDIVVYGGTAAAVTAALQARAMGKSVIVVSPDRHLGGMTSGGLGFTDSGNTGSIGGLAREFYRRMWRHYQDDASWKWQKRAEYGNRGQGTAAMDENSRTMWTFEPHAAERIFDDWIRESGIEVVREAPLDRRAGVKLEGNRIAGIATLDGRRYLARVFIDATYEGDLMAAAGVKYHVGRESNSVYGETWNGNQVGILHHGHFFKAPVDPYVIPGHAESGLLPRIGSDPPGSRGEGDARIQAYCFRMCLTRVPGNRAPFPRPDSYDPKQYELLLRVFASGWREMFSKFDAIPNGKTDTNNHGPFSTDNLGMNHDYPDASYERRREIIREHEEYQKGLMYFMANDSRIPEDVRTRIAEWGLAKDEFRDNGNWPHQIYVREARRMVGAYVMTERDCLSRKEAPQPVGMGSYTMDSHNVRRYVTPAGTVQNEGDIGVPVPGPYGIAYGAITPKRAECENLLVPVCVSTSHIAYGTVRMEPVFMILGQSAATAAAMAIDGNVAVQEVDYGRLRERLLKDGQVLERPRPR